MEHLGRAFLIVLDKIDILKYNLKEQSRPRQHDTKTSHHEHVSRDTPFYLKGITLAGVTAPALSIKYNNFYRKSQRRFTNSICTPVSNQFQL